MANITIALKDFTNSGATRITTVNPQALITVDNNKFACATDKMNLILSDGYVELSVEGRNIYKYTVGDTFTGNAKTASQMFDAIRESYSQI